MKILFEGYSCIGQNRAGGVSIKAKNLKTNLEENGFSVKYFDKWRDKISDCDILHIFMASSESPMATPACGISIKPRYFLTVV